jgi:hypothetical protein
MDTIRVTGDVIVAAAAHLTIQAGSVIMFNATTGLYIDGQLTANGEKSTRILFTSSADTVGGSPARGAWNGARFRINSAGSLHHCTVRYADYNVRVNKSSSEIRGCVIENFLLYGIYCVGDTIESSLVIDSSSIRQSGSALGTGVFVNGGVDVTISGCSISNCNYGVRINSASEFTPDFQMVGSKISDHSSYAIQVNFG